MDPGCKISDSLYLVYLATAKVPNSHTFIALELCTYICSYIDSTWNSKWCHYISALQSDERLSNTSRLLWYLHCLLHHKSSYSSASLHLSVWLAYCIFAQWHVSQQDTSRNISQTSLLAKATLNEEQMSDLQINGASIYRNYGHLMHN